jgi:pimeloyl-ACP methyl ester carboxylesterase
VEKALTAHGYGMLVFALQNAPDLFAPKDVVPAQAALRAWLQEDRDRSKELALSLSPAGQVKLSHLLDDRDAATRQELLTLIARHEAALRAMSPSARVSQLTVPAYLLHGAGDTVIPATETEWLARELPPAALRSALVSPALVHVDMGHGPSAVDRAHLVHFMAEVLSASDASS